MCEQPLLTRQFYVFPCRHVFHADCLVGRVVASVGGRRGRRILEVQEGIAMGLAEKGVGGKGTSGGGIEKLKVSFLLVFSARFWKEWGIDGTGFGIVGGVG